VDCTNEYQAKRKIFLSIAIPCFIIFFASIFFSFISSEYELVVFLVASTSIVIAILAQMNLNRCPNCDAVQFGHIEIKGNIVRTAGWATNPMECAWCKAKLNRT
jgi:hypothetical protein